MSSLLNYSLYQLGWFACVLGAAHGYPAWGAMVGLVLLAAHLGLVQHRGKELRLIAWAGLLGLAVETVHSCTGWLTFNAGYTLGCLAPPWIVVMWMQFATLLRFSMAFFHNRPLLASVLSALGGPLAFWIGARLGAVQLGPPIPGSLVVIGIVWAVAVPLLVRLAGEPAFYRFDRCSRAGK